MRHGRGQHRGWSRALIGGLLLAAAAAGAQPKIDVDRPLTDDEIAATLGAARAAMQARTVRLRHTAGGSAYDVLMGDDGRPARLRMTWRVVGGMVSGVTRGATGASPTTQTRTHWEADVTRLIDYAVSPVRRCDGSTEPGEMAIEYERQGEAGLWGVRAWRRAANETAGPGLAPLFAMLRGTVPIASGERRRLGDREAHAFTAAWTPPRDLAASTSSPGQLIRTDPPLIGDPRPNIAGEPPAQLSSNAAPTQTLWIDTISRLPLRWEVVERGRVSRHLDFVYEPIPDLQTPATGLVGAACVQ